MKYLVVVCIILLFEVIQKCSAGPKKNILFIISDDLRPQFGPYLGMEDLPIANYPRMHTPNINKLVSESLTFRKVYCQYPICAPSRTSFLTGRRPRTTGNLDFLTYFRKAGGNVTTIPQFFKENGYNTFGVGKIFHQFNVSNNNDPVSWTEPQVFIEDNWWMKPILWQKLFPRDIKDNPLHDDLVTKSSIQLLDVLGKAYHKKGTNFFLAIGYRKPHLPFTIPKKYYNKYPKIKVPDNLYVPRGLPDIAFGQRLEFWRKDKSFPTEKNNILQNKTIKELRRGYYAAVSFIDDQVGKILRKLKRKRLEKDTIVVFLGDHGYHLGENGYWGKRSSLELSNRTPLMIKLPGITDKGTGIITDELVELLDIFPTVVEAAGFESLSRCPYSTKASQSIALCSEGDSLLPLIEKPVNPNWKRAVFSEVHNPVSTSLQSNYKSVGYTVRTNEYRYTEWYPFDGTTLETDWQNRTTVEVYDKILDPLEMETFSPGDFDPNEMKELHELILYTFKK